jgi:hypothetical protein
MKTTITDNFNNVVFNYKIENNQRVTTVTGRRTTEKELYRLAIHHNWDNGVEVKMDSKIKDVKGNFIRVTDATALDDSVYGIYSEYEISVSIWETINN